MSNNQIRKKGCAILFSVLFAGFGSAQKGIPASVLTNASVNTNFPQH
jgi:hypothetical protein